MTELDLEYDNFVMANKKKIADTIEVQTFLIDYAKSFGVKLCLKNGVDKRNYRVPVYVYGQELIIVVPYNTKIRAIDWFLQQAYWLKRALVDKNYTLKGRFNYETQNLTLFDKNKEHVYILYRSGIFKMKPNTNV